MQKTSIEKKTKKSGHKLYSQTLYVYVTPKNRAYVESTSRKMGVSYSKLINFLIENAKT
jgi:hypothetical protein